LIGGPIDDGDPLGTAAARPHQHAHHHEEAHQHREQQGADDECPGAHPFDEFPADPCEDLVHAASPARAATAASAPTSSMPTACSYGSTTSNRLSPPPSRPRAPNRASASASVASPTSAEAP